ncbi:TetR/AcrR family transcriptional regulator [Paracoccus sp. 11-3]|uniref:TetR/AcrR family transcriptional regulator n=1 Tax=Paracoccus amoyensis TaxID=2760093 RepID=A0A926G8F9_9RHOB|nr:TetR/AcrR family transcriptional regulator [Paracoccus amoyensis]MBC9247798.1 TetR/AcrR family transcriptional regulator [Paracoccus amoyensis]
MTKKQKISQGRKFNQVVEGAKSIFLRDGYAGASVDEIAQAAAVSKATLYSYFPDKKLMFDEAIGSELRRQSKATPISVPPDATAQEAIPAIAQQISGWLVNPATVHLYRIHVAEAGRFADLAADYRRTMRKLLVDELRPQLDRWVKAGQLDIDDTTIAAEQLVRLAGTSVLEIALFGKRDAISEVDVKRSADAAAKVFLRAYRPTGNSSDRRLTAAE